MLRIEAFGGGGGGGGGFFSNNTFAKVECTPFLALTPSHKLLVHVSIFYSIFSLVFSFVQDVNFSKKLLLLMVTREDENTHVDVSVGNSYHVGRCEKNKLHHLFCYI